MINVLHYNSKKEARFWDSHFVDANMILVEINTMPKQFYFYHSMEG